MMIRLGRIVLKGRAAVGARWPPAVSIFAAGRCARPAAGERSRWRTSWRVRLSLSGRPEQSVPPENAKYPGSGSRADTRKERPPLWSRGVETELLSHASTGPPRPPHSSLTCAQPTTRSPDSGEKGLGDYLYLGMRGKFAFWWAAAPWTRRLLARKGARRRGDTPRLADDF